MIKFPLQVVLTAVDRWTAPLARMTAKVNATMKPLSEATERVGAFNKSIGFERVTSALSGVGSALGDVVHGFEVGFLRVGAILGSAGIAIWTIVHGTAAAGDAALKAARRTGVSVETYQELAHAARMAGLEVTDLDAFLGVFTRNLGRVATGNKQAFEGFGRLGIKVFGADHRIRPVADLLGEVADRLNMLDDPLKRNAITAMLFGKNSAKLATFLKDGSEGFREAAREAHALNVVIGPEQAKSSEEFLDKWTRVRIALEGVRNRIGLQLLPVIGELGDKLVHYLIARGPAIEAWARRFAEKLPERLDRIGRLVERLSDKLGPLLDKVMDIVEWIGPLESLLLAIGAAIAISVVPAVLSLIASIVTLSGVIVSTPFGWVILAVSAVILVFSLLAAELVYLYLNWDDIVADVKLLWEGFTMWFRFKTYQLLEPVRWIVRAWGGLTDFFSGLWANLKTGFTDVYDWIAAKVKDLTDLIPPWLRDAGVFSAKVALGPAGGLGMGLLQMAAGAAAPAASRTEVKLEFGNAPKGLRVTETRADSADLDLSLGYSMLGGG